MPRRHVPGQRVFKFCLIVRYQLEFEKCRPADKLQRPLPVRHAGQLHQDTVIALPQDGGLRHAELVDPIADDLHRAVRRVLSRLPVELGSVDA